MRRLPRRIICRDGSFIEVRDGRLRPYAASCRKAASEVAGILKGLPSPVGKDLEHVFLKDGWQFFCLSSAPFWSMVWERELSAHPAPERERYERAAAALVKLVRVYLEMPELYGFPENPDICQSYGYYFLLKEAEESGRRGGFSISFHDQEFDEALQAVAAHVAERLEKMSALPFPASDFQEILREAAPRYGLSLHTAWDALRLYLLNPSAYHPSGKETIYEAAVRIWKEVQDPVLREQAKKMYGPAGNLFADAWSEEVFAVYTIRDDSLRRYASRYPSPLPLDE